MRKTLIVHSRHAWRSYRTRAALKAEQGIQLLTIEQLAARLAGGFLQPIDHEDFKAAIADALMVPLGELEAIKRLPGFQRAAATSLGKAWSAGLDLTEEAKTASGPAAKARLEALAILEKEVTARLPKSQRRPYDLVKAALERIKFAPTVFGCIEIHGRTEMSPVWRPLLSAIAETTEVIWVAHARYIPNWLTECRVKVERRDATKPQVRSISCASPRHEILEALRWARQHLARGARPEQIAIATASPQTWDDHMLAISASANLPIHFVHGRAALSTSEGQLAAALAEVLLRGFSRTRVTRLVALLRSQNPHFTPLPNDWWRALPQDAPLLDTSRWQRAIRALEAEKFSDGVDHRPLLLEIIDTLSKGLNAAAEIGELLFSSRTLTIWRKALDGRTTCRTRRYTYWTAC